MSYMLLVVEASGDRRTRSPAQGQERMNLMRAWNESLRERGLLLAADSLRSDAEAVRVQVREGRHSLRDGPFAEAKEMIGGYFILDCASREQAVALAGECPAAAWAVIEVRALGPCTE